MSAANDAGIHLTPEQEREAFSKQFPGIVPANVRPLDDFGNAMAVPSPSNTEGMSEGHIKYLTRMYGAAYRLKLQGIQFATVLNMNPYPLKVNSVLLGHIVVPARPAGQKYSVKVIKEVLWSREDGVDGDGHPIPWVPIILAREFMETYFHNGGVVIYTGDGESEPPSETLKKNESLARNYKEAEARQLAWARVKKREADGEWNTPNRQGARNINDIHRACAALLHDVTGEEMPAWMEKIPGQFGLGSQCPNCKAIPQSGAVGCSACGYILDPKTAFEGGTIEIEDASLTRLSRKVLEEMGISELIEETIEERNQRLRAKAEELRKEKKAAAKK